MRSLLHLCDIISNKYPRLHSTFFNSTDYTKWLSNMILRYFLCHQQNCNSSSFSTLLTKCCILGYVDSLATTYYHFCLLSEKRIQPENSDERLFLIQFNQSERFSLLQHFLSLLPSLRMNAFCTRLFGFMFSPNSNQVCRKFYYI